MKEKGFDGRCKCPCEAVELRLRKPPVTRFYCHCTICQKVYRKPYADVTVHWAWNVEIPDKSLIRFKKYRPFPALQRGTCLKCEHPVAGFLTLFPFVRLAFVPTHMYGEVSSIPSPAGHIFSHRAVAPIDDALPSYSGYVKSELAVMKFFMAGMKKS